MDFVAVICYPSPLWILPRPRPSVISRFLRLSWRPVGGVPKELFCLKWSNFGRKRYEFLLYIDTDMTTRHYWTDSVGWCDNSQLPQPAKFGLLVSFKFVLRAPQVNSITKLCAKQVGLSIWNQLSQEASAPHIRDFSPSKNHNIISNVFKSCRYRSRHHTLVRDLTKYILQSWLSSQLRRCMAKRSCWNHRQRPR